MSRKKQEPKPRSWFEPWTALPSPQGPEPNVEGLPEDVAASILDGWDRAKRKAPWVIWGSGMVEPSVAKGYLSGKPVAFDDRQVIAIRKPTTDREDGPTAEETAKRIAACVNAMAGVADPVAFMESVRELLKNYSLGIDCCEPATADLRFVRLWCQCVPMSEREKGIHEESEPAAY